MPNEIKAFANFYGYSDVNPFEVVKVISDKTVEVRAMKAEKDPTWKPDFVPGGFSAHCINQHEQRWIIEQDLEAPVIRIRYSAARRRWQDKHGARYIMADKPRKFYDYNF